MAKEATRTIEEIDLKLPKGTQSPLPIKTVYYLGRKVVRTNRSGKPLPACGNCLQYLRSNKYEATHAEVYDMFTGKLYSVQKLDVHGNVHTLFQLKFSPNEV
jgi:hypothetical protein